MGKVVKIRLMIVTNFAVGLIKVNLYFVFMIDAKLIEKFAACIGYEFNQEGSKPSVVIVGERHEPIERCCQEKLIVMLKPEYVLIETFMEGAEHDAWFKRWKEKYCCKFDRCDIKVDELTGEIGQDDIREPRMGQIVLDYQKKSSESLIAIIGNWHARKDSKIHEILNRHIDYICIWSKKAVIEVEEKRKEYY